MSSMESAPATIPATSAVTFDPACAPWSVATVRWRSASLRRPTRAAKRQHRDQPRGRHEIRLVWP